MDPIRTYLLLPTGNGDGVERVYEISDFQVSQRILRYNPHTLEPENNDLSFTTSKEDHSDIINMFEGKKLSVCVVKFWGKINQEYVFTGCYLSSGDASHRLSINYDHCQFSDKNDRMDKFSIKLIIPYLRDKKINDILS